MIHLASREPQRTLLTYIDEDRLIDRYGDNMTLQNEYCSTNVSTQDLGNKILKHNVDPDLMQLS